MFEDDFLGKTSEMLNGFFESIEKGIKGLQKEVEDAKESVKKDVEKAKETEQAESVTEEKKDDAKQETGRKGYFADLFSKAREAVEGTGKALRKSGIPYNRMDTKDTVTIACELPGCDKKDISLNYEQDTIIVRAKRTEPKAAEGVTFRESVGCKYGEMEQKFRVGKVDSASIRAAYKDGILSVSCKRPVTDSNSGINIE